MSEVYSQIDKCVRPVPTARYLWPDCENLSVHSDGMESCKAQFHNPTVLQN